MDIHIYRYVTLLYYEYLSSCCSGGSTQGLGFRARNFHRRALITTVAYLLSGPSHIRLDALIPATTLLLCPYTLGQLGPYLCVDSMELNVVQRRWQLPVNWGFR